MVWGRATSPVRPQLGLHEIVRRSRLANAGAVDL
jgi:hypothetical protein